MTNLIIIIVVIILLLCFWPKTEHYKVPEQERNEYVPQSMSMDEYREMTKYIYPDYLNY